MRRALPLFLASLLLVALAGPVAAQTPLDERRVRTDVPLGTYDFTLPGADYCGFDLLVEDISGTITEVFITVDRHGNTLLRTIFHTVTRYTNVQTGESFERRFDSVGNFTLWADGSSRIIGRNDSLLWYLEGDASTIAPGVWLVDHGRIIEEYDADGNLTHAAVLEADEIIDVCAMLG
jgi:hypothetical protein